jgi:hypothetical protein
MLRLGHRNKTRVYKMIKDILDLAGLIITMAGVVALFTVLEALAS